MPDGILRVRANPFWSGAGCKNPTPLQKGRAAIPDGKGCSLGLGGLRVANAGLDALGAAFAAAVQFFFAFDFFVSHEVPPNNS